MKLFEDFCSNLENWSLKFLVLPLETVVKLQNFYHENLLLKEKLLNLGYTVYHMDAKFIAKRIS